ncbi:MAG: hypothetical protein ACRYFK_16645 [Janthinobacterium lividum]
MYRPAFIPKLRLSYAKTWAKVLAYVRAPERIKPAAAPAHLEAHLHPQKTIKLPQLRGNLVHTLKEIVRLFMDRWAKAPTAINLALFTTRTAMAKAGSNRDPKTGYRHIMALIEYGFLRGKQQVKGGLQLLLEPSLFVFEGTPAVAAALLPAPLPVALVSPQEAQLSLLEMARKFTEQSGRNLTKNGRRTT